MVFTWKQEFQSKKADVSLQKLNNFLIAEASNSYNTLRNMEAKGWEIRDLDIRVIVTYKRNGKKMKGIIKPEHAEVERQYFLNNAELKAMQK